MDALIKYAELRSLNFKQGGRQKDLCLSTGNSQESHKMCQRQQKVKMKFLLVKEIGKNSVPIFSQYRTEWIYLLKPANFMFWLDEEWFQVYQLAVWLKKIQETVLAFIILCKARALWMKNRNRTIVEQDTVTACSEAPKDPEKHKDNTRCLYAKFLLLYFPYHLLSKLCVVLF